MWDVTARLKRELISHEVFFKSFCGSQFPHKSVKSSLTITNIDNKLTDLRGCCLLQNDLKNIWCEIGAKRVIPQRGLPRDFRPISEQISVSFSMEALPYPYLLSTVGVVD